MSQAQAQNSTMFIFASLGSISSAGSPRADCTALLALFKTIGGSAWRNNRGWNTHRPLNEWFGVILNAEGRVVELHLGWNNLRGDLMPRPPLIFIVRGYTWEAFLCKAGGRNAYQRVPFFGVCASTPVLSNTRNFVTCCAFTFRICFEGMC